MEEHELLVAVNISVDGSQKMAGFEVSINGRFWVSTEAKQRMPEHPPPARVVARQIEDRERQAHDFRMGARTAAPK